MTRIRKLERFGSINHLKKNLKTTGFIIFTFSVTKHCITDRNFISLTECVHLNIDSSKICIA